MDNSRDARLTEAVKKDGKDWVSVAAMVLGRTNSQCRERWIKSFDPANGEKGQWTPAEDEKLTDSVKKHGKDWVAVAAMVPGRTNSQCRERWIKSLDPANENKGKPRISWKPEEDARLTEVVKKHGKDCWVVVAALLPSRTNNQCRQRWVKNLDPDRASNTAEEEHSAGNGKAHESLLV
jgi:myb proto-oncogene protein